MKKQNIILLLTILLTVKATIAQVTLSVMQDAKMALVGEDVRNSVLDINILLTFKSEEGITAGLSYEYSDLINNYSSIFMFYGYSIEPLDKVITSVSIGYGLIARNGLGSWSYQSDLKLSYMLSKSIGVTSSLQITRRRDLEIPKFITSGFIGVDFVIF